MLYSVLLLLFVVGAAQGEDVTLSANAVNCSSSGCKFEDPSIWSTGVVPTELSNVIVDNNFGILFSLIISENHHVHSLNISSVNVTVSGNLIVTEALTAHYTTVLILGSVTSGHFWAFNFTEVALRGELHVVDVNGTTFWDFNTNFTLYQPAKHEVFSATADYGGYLWVGEGVTFISHGSDTKLWNATVFESRPVINHLHLIASSDYYFNDGLIVTIVTVEPFAKVYVHTHLVIKESLVFADENGELSLIRGGPVESNGVVELSTIGGENVTAIIGDGILYIENSNVSILNKNGAELLNRLVLVGINRVQLAAGEHTSFNDSNLHFQIDDQNNYPYTTFVVVDLSLTGPLTVYGEIHLDNTKLYIKDQVRIPNGGITSISSHLEIDGQIVLGKSLHLVSEGGVLSSLHLINTNLSVPEVVLEHNTSLTTSGNNFIEGSLINGGTVTSTQKDLLRITGNYTQTSAGALYADDLDESYDDKAVRVEGSAILDGILSYKLKSPSKSRTYVLLHATELLHVSENRTAEFTNTLEVSGSKKEGEVKIEITRDTVFLKFEHTGGKNNNAGKIAGIVIGVIVGVILIIVIVYFLVKRKRQGYKELRH